MNTLVQDVRFALRQLRRAPGFTFTVVLMLALGIGANTAVFSVMNAVLMQMLPVSRPHGLYYVHEANGQFQPPGAGNTGDSNTSFSEAAYETLRQRHDVFDDLIAYVPLSLNGMVAVRHGALPEEAEGEEVSGNFFSGLGARIERGRGFTPGDEKNHTPVAVISYDYWTRSYARDLDIVGQTIYIKGIPMTVVGIAAHGFKGIEPATATDFWIPLQNRPELNAWGTTGIMLYGSPKWWSLRLMARLRPGGTPIQAQQALAGTFGEVARQAVGTIDPKQWKPLLDFTPARGIFGYSEQYSKPVHILMGLVGLVLLIACANVCMMLQARNSARQSEYSLRLAIGAGRMHLFRQLLTESLLLVIAGAALGWAFALGATRALAFWASIETGFAPDRNVLSFTLSVSALAALLFGLVPLWSATHAPVAGVLRSTASGVSAGRSRSFAGRAVMAAQIAVSLVLLMSAMLLLRTLRNYAQEDLGMKTDNLLVFGVTPQGVDNDIVFFRTLLDRIRQTPGVESACIVENRPGTGWTDNNDFSLDGVYQRGAILRTNNVGPDFFHTMGVPILAGRDIANSDTQETPRVAVVNESFVKQYLHGVNPLGHNLGGAPHPYTIVGVARDSKYSSTDEKSMPMAYYAILQFRKLGTTNIEVRTHGAAMAALPQMRRIVASLDANVPLDQPMTQKAQFEESFAQQRMFAAMGGFFGVLAALLVATGLYGTYSFRVSRRTTEIGVRMALGASRAQVLAMVLSESVWVLVAGLAVGVPLTYFAARPLKSMLYQMSPLDPISFVVAIAAMIAVSVCAVLLPARRAASIEPMQALRAE
jgi:predicted permease